VAQDSICRVVLVVDKQANGSIAQMFAPAGVDQGSLLNYATPTPHAYRDLTCLDRFHVIKDWKFLLKSFRMGTNAYAREMLTLSAALDFDVHYDAGGPWDPRSCNLLLMACADSSPCCDIRGVVRVRYVDS